MFVASRRRNDNYPRGPANEDSGTETGSCADRCARHRQHLPGRLRAGTRTGFQPQGRRDGLEHQARARRRRATGADHRARRDHPGRRQQRDGRPEPHFRKQYRGIRKLQLRHRRCVVRQPDRLAARPGWAIHAGARQRQAPRLVRRRNHRRRGGQPLGDPGFGHRQGRGADRRRVRYLRQRRDRRGDQLHHAPGLHGRRRDGPIRCADAQRGWRAVDIAGHPRRGRPGEGQVQRLRLDPVPGTEIAGPKGPQFLEYELRSGTARPDVVQFVSGQCLRSGNRSHPRHSWIPELRAVDRPGRPVPLRSGAHERRPVDPPAIAVEPLRLRTIPDQCGLEGIPDGNVFALEQQVHHSAESAFHRGRCPGAARRQCGHRHSADEPVLPASVGRRQRRRRAAPQRAVSLLPLWQPRQRGHERCVADRNRDQGHGMGLVLGRIVQLQREHVQGAAQKRLLPVHADHSPPEQHHQHQLQSVRSEPGFGAAGNQRAAVHRRSPGQQAGRLRHRPQGDRRYLRTAGGPARRRGGVSGG